MRDFRRNAGAASCPATFAGQEAYRPPLTIQAAKDGRDVRIGSTMR